MNLIVAVTNDYAIGKDGDLLFHLPSDLKYFKSVTMGKVVIFGERTYLSLPKRPLPGRTNIVISDNNKFVAENAIVVHSLQDLLTEIARYNTDDVFVCGGASIYNLLMPYCKYAYITRVDIITPADTYINDITKCGYKLVKSSNTINDNGYNIKFCVYKNSKIKKASS